MITEDQKTTDAVKEELRLFDAAVQTHFKDDKADIDDYNPLIK
jgi:hypothetical protein